MDLGVASETAPFRASRQRVLPNRLGDLTKPRGAVRRHWASRKMKTAQKQNGPSLND
jgi:hypothetical protein